MPAEIAVIAVAVLLVAYALVARRLTTTPVTGPIVFVSAGMLLGPAGTDTLADISIETLRLVVEAALVLVLFTDAAAFRLRWRRSDLELPARLLGIGLPLTIALGTVLAAVMIGGLELWEAAALAVILAPTDGAVGQAIVSNPLVPSRIRGALNVESGLNDGIAVPFLSILLAAGEAEASGDPMYILVTFATALVPALLVGVVVGWTGGKLLVLAARRGWTSPGWSAVAVIAIAALTYVGADALAASGFVSAFVGGLAFGVATRAEMPDTPELAEGITHLAALIAFMVVGAAVLDPELQQITPSMAVYALLSLTVVRMLPVAVSMIGSGLRPRTILYLGWSGPRGLATIVFATILLLDAPGAGVTLVVTVAVLTSTISVYAHGLTAWPLSSRYGRWFRETKAAGATLAEAQPSEPLMRRRRMEPDFVILRGGTTTEAPSDGRLSP
jgi:NhaP-type Na+/H+ or K+/H+ antiporter